MPTARSDTQDPVLHRAVEQGNDGLVALLLTAGADPRYRADLDESVFDAVLSAGEKRDRILALLADHGVVADVS